MKSKRNKQEAGITLLALVITIIILLILAGITINAITGDNGIIGNAGKAKEETEITNEKEIIEKATIQAMGNNKYGNIEESELQSELDKETKEGKTEVADVGDEFEVVFNESKRYYTVDKDGNVEGAYEIIEDTHPGDITVGKDGETLDGSEEKPYEIWCIEDLVAFSNMVNGEGIRLENSSPIQITSTNRFFSKYVVLKTSLNFKSKLSYQNSERTDFGDINGNENDGNTLMNEMTTENGFKPIGMVENTGFGGVFDGQNYWVKEIYISREDREIGLFAKIGNVSSVVIENLRISGEMIGNSGGSIVGTVSLGPEGSNIILQNCINHVNIKTTSLAGGVVGSRGSGASDKTLMIADCINYGKIEGQNFSGGIIGMAYENTKIINCCNTGEILNKDKNGGYEGAGGIVGTTMFKINIINTYNLGNIKAEKNAGGILGYSYWAEKNIENCYNMGRISGSTVGGIIGGLNLSNDLLITQNCYYLNTNISKGIGGWNTSAEALEDIQGLTDSEIKSSEIIEKLNNYVIENATREGIELKKWIKGGDEYPVFDNRN